MRKRKENSFSKNVRNDTRVKFFKKTSLFCDKNLTFKSKKTKICF